MPGERGIAGTPGPKGDRVSLFILFIHLDFLLIIFSGQTYFCHPKLQVVHSFSIRVLRKCTVPTLFKAQGDAVVNIRDEPLLS